MEVNIQPDISSAASNEMKFHPLIMEQSFIRDLLEVSNGISVEHKLAFLYDFHDSLKKILTCVGCDGIRREDSLAFSCGHRYCKICSKNMTFCLKCKTKGRQRGSIIEQDYSGLLAISERLQKNFHVERIFFESLKFFLTTPHWLKQGDSAAVTCNIFKNSPQISQDYSISSNKFTATRKHFKTLTDKADHFKKKLIFSPDVSVVQPQISKHDSARLNVTPKTEVSDSYLNLQLSTNESRNSPIVESPSNHRKRAKRKLSKNYLTESTSDNRRPKTRKISKPEAFCLDDHSGSPLRSTKHVSDENASSSPSIPSTNTRSRNAEGSPDSSEKVKIVTRSNSLENEAHEYRGEEYAENAENSAGPIHVRKSNEPDSSSRIEIDGLDDKQELARVQLGGSKNGNSVLSLPDPEMEEAVDINLWQHDEKVSRKKKALMFKSVKERNRRRIFFEGSVKLHSTGANVNVVQLESDVSNGSKSNDLKQSPEKMSAKDEADAATKCLNSNGPMSDQAVSTKMTSSLGASSSSNWVMKTNVESNLVGESSQTRISKLDADVPNIGNEPEIQVSRIQVPKIEPSITEKSSLVPSTTESTVETFPDGSKMEVENGLLSKTDSSISTEAPFETTELMFSAETNRSTNLESLHVDIVCKKSPASVDLPADEPENYTSSEFPSNFPRSPITTESSSCSVEVIEKSSQETVATISDTVIEGDQDHVREIVTSIRSEPVTVYSSSSEDNVMTANKTNQPAVAIKPDGTEEVDVASSARLKSDEFLVNTRTKEKCSKLKKAINDQNEQSFDNIRSTFSFVSPKALSVKRYKGQNNSTSIVNVDSSLKKVESDRINFPENSNESPKKSTSDAINSSDCEKSVLFSKKNSDSVDEMLTIPTSPRCKSVSCQTTSDLHVSLLKQEFPHLFNRNGKGVSVYDTPDRSTLIEARENLVTPFISRSPRRTPFTAISSVTSSEKKVFDHLFTDHSVLDDSSFHSAFTEKIEDISIEPLPSTGKKVCPANSTSENLCQNVRSNLDLDCSVDLEKQNISACLALSTPHSQTRVIYGSSVNATPRKSEMDVGVLKRAANESNTADFVDSDHTNDIDSTALKKISDEQKLISNGFRIAPPTRPISPEAVGNHVDPKLTSLCNATPAKSHASDNETTLLNESDVDDENNDIDDDDDVEFIAGTPSGSRRCVDDNLEKLMTQSFSLRSEFREDVSTGNKNDGILCNAASSTNHKSSPTSQSIDHSRPPPPLTQMPVSESLDLFNSTAASSVQEASPSLALVITGLKDADVKLVKAFCQRFSVSLMDRVTSETTHLVVKTDRKSRTARTFKYLQAIVNSICVISIEWVQACLNTNEILNEEKFIPFDSSGECGPLRAYKSRRELIPSPLSWLHDYCLFFMEPVPSACTLTQLQEIVVKTGAVVVTDLRDFKKYVNLHHLIIVSDEEESSQISNTDIANWLQIYQAVAIEFNWLLEVVGRNRVVPFADYELVEIPPNLLLKLNFPDEMLQYEKEDVEDSD